MGMSLATKVFYGWYLGDEESLEMPENFDYYDFSEVVLKNMTIETAHWCDYASYYLVIKNNSEYDWTPIDVESLPVMPELTMSNRNDIELLENKTGWKIVGKPKWLVTSEWF